MAWVLLIVAGLMELGWASGLKYTEGFALPGPSIFTLAAMVASVVSLGIPMKSLAGGPSYAVLANIALMLGCSDQAALSRACKRWFGVSPGSYAARVAAEGASRQRMQHVRAR